MGLPGKTIGMDGGKAVMAWKDPARRWDVMRYVEQDARTTLDLALICDRDRRLNWISRRGNPQTLFLPNGWYTVSISMDLPEPDTSWMDSPILRSDFTLWLERDEPLYREEDSWLTQSFGKTDAWDYVKRGDDYAQRSDYDRAIADYERAIELDPRCAEVFTIHISYMNRGDVRREKGDYDQAIAYCNVAIELFPKHTGTYYIRGKAYVVKGDYDQAIADCSNAIELEPTYAAAYYLRAVAYARNGDHSQAMADYGRAVELEPIYAETEYRSPVGYIQKGRAQSPTTGRGCMTTALISLAIMSFLAVAYFW